MLASAEQMWSYVSGQEKEALVAEGHFSSCTSDSLKECWCEARRYFLALGVVTVTFVVQLLGGWYFHSLALWADAAHLATDILAYGIAIRIAFKIRKSPARGEKLRRSGMVWTVLLLVVALGGMLAEVPDRFLHPPDVSGMGMIFIAAIAAVGNMIQHRIVSAGESHDTTHGLVLHILTDLVSSCVIVVAGILLLLTGMLGIDAIATVIVVLWSMWRSHALLMGDDHHHGHSH